MSHPFLIVQVEPPQAGNQGDYFYRTYAPGVSMAKEDDVWVVTLTNVHRRKHIIMDMADVLILKNISDPDLLPLMKKRNSESKPTVFEIADDLNALQPWNPVYPFFKNPENLSTLYHLARRCDALQFTVTELQRLYGHLNNRHIVFPNQILQPPPERRLSQKRKTIIGWGGSHGHLEDMAEIAPYLIEWMDQHPEVHLCLMGSDPIWRLFDDIPRAKKTHILPGSLDDYYRFLSTIDIGVGHLKNTAFNRSRSDVKFLEYAVSGVVPVMTHLESYLYSLEHGRTGFLYHTIEECLQILDHLVENPTLRYQVSRSAREYVLKERLQEQHNENRIDFYGSLVPKNVKPRDKSQYITSLFHEWSLLEGSAQQGRYLNLRPSHFEMLLHDGLVAMQMDGDPERADDLFHQASILEPDNHLPYLYGATVSADPIDNLKKAVERMPHSIKARLLLGQEYFRKGDVKAALESFDSAARICPDYEVPYHRVVSLLQTIGEKEQAEILMQKTMSLNTCYGCQS